MTTATQTVLFTDMVGSTAFAAEMRDDHAQRLRLAHIAMLDREVERHHGRRVKSLGDGVMATFTAARNAVECAVAMQRGATFGSATATHQPIRAGISSGDVGMVNGDCYGVAVIEASRLCESADGGDVLLTEATRLLARSYQPLVELDVRCLRGLRDAIAVWRAPIPGPSEASLRVVLADDAPLLREGLARVLEARGVEVLGHAGDATELLQLVHEQRPDVAIVDLRMPPTRTEEGIAAAERIVAECHGTRVLILSQDLVPRYARRLARASDHGIGYLLKERVADLDEFVGTLRHIADGGVSFEPALGVPVP